MKLQSKQGIVKEFSDDHAKALLKYSKEWFAVHEEKKSKKKVEIPKEQIEEEVKSSIETDMIDDVLEDGIV